jgi:hypothetical protein
MTNSNQKIAWITAVNDGSDLLQTNITVTGCTATSTTYAVGGRLVWTPGNVEAALRAGDTIQFNNTPATATATYITARTSGDSTTGYITLKGKSGVRPVLNVTNTSNVLTLGSQSNWWIENLQLDQDGASGNVVTGTGTNNVFYNVKIVDGGGIGISTASQMVVENCEISGVSGDGINSSATAPIYLIGNYIHDNTGDGIEISTVGPAGTIFNNIIDANGGKGIFLSGASTAFQGRITNILGNTIYANGGSGVEVTDADTNVVLTNNIIVNATGQKTVVWTAGTAQLVSFHAYNDFYDVDGGGAGALTNLTVNSQVAASEVVTNPSMSNPASGNFTILTSSPAYATAFPGVVPGTSSTTSFQSMGATQVVGVASSSGSHSLILGGP